MASGSTRFKSFNQQRRIGGSDKYGPGPTASERRAAKRAADRALVLEGFKRVRVKKGEVPF